MGRRDWLVVACMVLLLGCDKLRPGFCETANDCPSGQMCNTSTYQCTGGGADGGMDGPMQGVDGLPFDASGCKSDDQCLGKGVCNVGAGLCVQCLLDLQCTTATAPLCKGTVCGGCEDDAPCVGRSDDKLACDTTTGACVTCVKDANCGGATPVCDTATKRCVECRRSAECPQAAPVCGTNNKCAKCTTNTECEGLGQANQRWCKPDTGQCVQCLDSEVCTGTTPFCGSNKCVACGGDDAKCVGSKAEPGVCLGDGHCAQEAEAIYVKYTAMCDVTPAGGAGTQAAPLCTVNASAKSKLSSSRSLIVIRGPIDKWALDAPAGFRIIVVGQQSAEVIGGTGGIVTITGGDVEIRKLTITGGGSSDGIRLNGSGTTLVVNDSTARRNGGAGIAAVAGTTLKLNGCDITENGGGGVLLDGAAFEISNTKITGNGPGQNGATTWGGVLVLNPPGVGPKKIEASSIVNNKVVGVACTGAVTASGVLVSGNGAVEVATACGFMSCGVAGAMCGAQ